MASSDFPKLQSSDDSSGRENRWGDAKSLWPSSASHNSVARNTQASRSRARRLAPWIAGTVSLLLLLTTLLIGWRVRESMRRVNRTSIETIRSANVAIMDLWLTARTDDVSVALSDAKVRSASLALLNAHGNRGVINPSDLQSKDARDATSQLARIAFDRRDYLGWCVIDSRGTVLASDHPEWVAVQLPIPLDTQDQIDRSITTVTRPFVPPVSLAKKKTKTTPDANAKQSKTGKSSSKKSLSGNAPVMLAIAPISEGVRSLGALVLIIDPLQKFCDLLQSARIGKSCETIAFDRSGVLITRSRFESQLRQSGLLSSDRRVTSALNVHSRVPSDSPIPSGTQSPKLLARQMAELTLTEAADQATRGAAGSNLTGYLDYRGVNVIGTWCWVPKYNFGVVTKMDYEEAYGPMQILRNAFIMLLGVVGLASMGLFALVAIIRRFAADQTPVRRLGQYDLTESLGHGGMGRVYRGRHESLRRDVAVKVLEPTAVNHHSFARFEREVRLTAKLGHPNTIDIYDFGRTDDGTFFYVMEFVEGISLDDLIREDGWQSPGRVIHILTQICGSLNEAHEQGMVHRDIKPANILLSSGVGVCDLVKVLDFGLVREIDHDTLQLTQSASITGTPLYMSPEAIRDASTADARSDIYSLGAVGYHLLCGQTVFSGELAADVCAKQLHEIPLRPCQRAVGTNQHGVNSDFPDDLQDILMNCLQKDPLARPQSMAELADALGQCQDACNWKASDARSWWETRLNRAIESPRDLASDFADNAP
ncbi:serine/threonine-protein kinase [Planctomycetes bacterium K23_9]|uniref:Serine/threonine-protein kinase PknB n=1 Tax=Stieleria marina TaxID=1930275 RepID=A0A517NU38_9BACT|nr:Serine/threonine-protein kinase PknB [Planctomycetes bacterium K23_9]